ncbi:MAG: hypothetical protein MUE49_03090 [Rhodospirillales bacterium]|nr:hypothetical protein [Rhodospirillales bacterium]
MDRRAGHFAVARQIGLEDPQSAVQLVAGDRRNLRNGASGFRQPDDRRASKIEELKIFQTGCVCDAAKLVTEMVHFVGFGRGFGDQHRRRFDRNPRVNAIDAGVFRRRFLQFFGNLLTSLLERLVENDLEIGHDWHGDEYTSLALT